MKVVHLLLGYTAMITPAVDLTCSKQSMFQIADQQVWNVAADQLLRHLSWQIPQTFVLRVRITIVLFNSVNLFSLTWWKLLIDTNY